jgi:hypothetical protein
MKAKNLGVGLAQLIKDLDSKYQSTVKQGVAEGSNPEKVEVRFSAKEYAAMSPAQKAAKQKEWQQLKQQAKMRMQNFTLIDTDKERNPNIDDQGRLRKPGEVAEALLGADDDYNRGQKVPDWAKRGIIGKIGRKLDPAWSDVQIVIPKHLLPKPSSAPASNAPATKDMPKTTSTITNRAIPQSVGTKPLRPVTKNVVKTIADKQGMLDNKNKKA